MSRYKSLEAHFSGLYIVEEIHRKFTPMKVTRNPDMIKEFLFLATGNQSWFGVDCSVPYTRVGLHWKSRQYEEVVAAFEETNTKDIIVDIERLDNPFILAQYLLKGAYRNYLEGPKKAVDLFHGTKHQYLDSICKTNLNWRMFGKGPFLGNRYGQGVSFSTSFSYASMFPRGDPTTPRIMLMCKVLVRNVTVGKAKTRLPPENADATGSVNGEVIVKYDDNEFYPKYIIYYEEKEEDDYSSDSMVDYYNSYY